MLVVFLKQLHAEMNFHSMIQSLGNFVKMATVEKCKENKLNSHVYLCSRCLNRNEIILHDKFYGRFLK